MPSGVQIQIGISVRNIPSDKPALFAKMFLNSCGYFTTKNSVETETQGVAAFVEFQTYMSVDYIFEEKQTLMVEIYSCSGAEKEDAKLFGSVEFSIGRTIHSGGEDEVKLNSRRVSLAEPTESTNWGTSVVVCIRENPAKRENIVLKMHGEGLDKKDIFGKSDPYILILRKNGRGKWNRCYRSEVVKKSLTPDWKPMLISLDRLCEGDLESELCFRCFDWDGARGDPDIIDPDIDDVIGEFITTPRQLLSCQSNGRNFELINKVKCKKKKFYNNSGIVNVRLSLSSNACSFLDYVLSGTSVNVVVGIDLSSQSPSCGQTPHYFSDALAAAKSAVTCSEYAIAIQAVVEILQEYDSDELFPAYGFGVRAPPDGKIAHTFPLTGDPSNPNCRGVAGVLAAYNRVASEARGTAPPNFSPLIKLVNEMARNARDSGNYFVLLILTTGFVEDWVDTRRAVIEASYLPISIIFIGVGRGKFEELQVLDQDFALLKVGQEHACRDNVQFVEMRRFLRLAADGSDEIRWNKVGLAKDVLAELPTQMMDHFFRNRITPQRHHPSRPDRIEQLADPLWWRGFMESQRYQNPSGCNSNRAQSRSATNNSSPEEQRSSRIAAVESFELEQPRSKTTLHIVRSGQARHQLRFADDVHIPASARYEHEESERYHQEKPTVRSVVSTAQEIASYNRPPVRMRPKSAGISMARMRRQLSFEDPALRRNHGGFAKPLNGSFKTTQALSAADESLEMFEANHPAERQHHTNLVGPGDEMEEGKPLSTRCERSLFHMPQSVVNASSRQLEMRASRLSSPKKEEKEQLYE